ncbi:hypothetical protein NXS19_004375 [Fusarium pseudograminearum]|nr:hypothetical protein NXS19_004375 [Fusarium pseudograminearum]
MGFVDIILSTIPNVPFLPPAAPTGAKNNIKQQHEPSSRFLDIANLHLSPSIFIQGDRLKAPSLVTHVTTNICIAAEIETRRIVHVAAVNGRKANR